MLIKMSFKGLVDILGYSALLKSHIKSQYLFRWNGGTTFTDKRARVGGLQIVTGNRLEPHFLENEEGYRKSEYTIATGIKKQSVQYMLGFSKVNTIFFAFAGDDFNFSITEML